MAIGTITVDLPSTATNPKEAQRAYLRREGRDCLSDRRCYDCFPNYYCEWCNGGALRQQQRLHDALNADWKEWLSAS